MHIIYLWIIAITTKFLLKKEDVERFLKDEEWWFYRFGEDPLWGKAKKIIWRYMIKVVGLGQNFWDLPPSYEKNN